MKDFAGNELEVGMKVVCLSAGPNTRWMMWAEVMSFTPKMVRLKVSETVKSIDYSTGITRDHHSVTYILRDPSGIVLPMNPELADYVQAEILRANLTS